jgi:hypothetical protein
MSIVFELKFLLLRLRQVRLYDLSYTLALYISYALFDIGIHTARGYREDSHGDSSIGPADIYVEVPRVSDYCHFEA